MKLTRVLKLANNNNKHEKKQKKVITMSGTPFFLIEKQLKSAKIKGNLGQMIEKNGREPNLVS